MKIFCTTNKTTYDIQFKNMSGENHMPCPVCSSDRKKQKAKSFSFNVVQNVGNCLHCGAKFTKYRDLPKKDYKYPEQRKGELSELLISWFNKRGISKETLQAAYITESLEYFPQVNKKNNAICFNYYRGEKLVNIKFRDGAKNFTLSAGSELIFYNLNSIIGKESAVICEGEIDCLSFIESGIKNVVSVPNGANKNNTNLEFLDNCIDEIESVKTFYIATDNDTPGINLRNELIRRLGAENCKIIDFSIYDCKDCNELLVKYDKQKVNEVFKNAKDAPLTGVYDLENDLSGIYDLWENGMPKGKLTRHSALNEFITWNTSTLGIITGIPSHGKSEFVDEICTHLNVLNGWKTGYYSPENFPIKIHVSKIVSKISGKYFSKSSIEMQELNDTLQYVNENYFFIYPENEDYTIDNILEHARILIKRKGIKILVIDPYNKIDHQMEAGQSETQYISTVLDKLDMFARKHDLLLFLVAHPRKIPKDKNGAFEIPTLYDVSGSAHFYNKAFYGICVFRKPDLTEVHIQKVKYKHLGQNGIVSFGYDWQSGRYYEVNPAFITKECDTTSYLNIQKVNEIKPNKEFDYTQTEEEAPF